MKAISLHIAFAALLSLLSLASCSRNDQITVPSGEEGKVYVTLTLSINGEEAGSRATWENNDNPEEGNEWENTINDLQILIYDENNQYVGCVENLIQLLDDRYSGTLSTAAWKANKNYKVMAFANCPTINQNNIETLSYTRTDVEYIPMWGVTTTTFDLTPGESDDIGGIDLLRAMAKIEVIMDADGYSIDKIEVDKSNPQGYCLPQGYNSVTETDKLDMEGATPASFHPNTSDNPITKEQDGKYYIYLPEYDNSTDAAKIQVTVNGETYPLEFRNYENGAPTGNPYDIVRNHIYRYTITGVNDGKLTVKYRALQWDLVTSEIGYEPQPISTTDSPFGGETEYEQFMNDSHHYILLPVEAYSDDYNTTRTLFNHLYENPNAGDNEARLCILTRPTYDTNKKYIDLKTGSAGARYYFMLTGPKGATWEAHLSSYENFQFSNSENTDFENNTDQFGNEPVRMVTHGIARNKPYIIQIIATHLYTGYEEGMSGETDGIASDAYEKESISADEWSGYFEDTYLTDWGWDKWNNEHVVEVEFYITVKLADGTKYELEINPSYSSNTKIGDEKFPFKDKRRYDGNSEGTRIRIRQVRAKYGIERLEDLAKDGTEWWQDSPNWNPNYK